VLLKRPDGCKLDRTFSTPWRVQTEVHVIRTDDDWSDWRSDGMARHPDGLNSCQMSVRTAEREPKSSQCKVFLEISE
jgi:hypothetical protein